MRKLIETACTQMLDAEAGKDVMKKVVELVEVRNADSLAGISIKYA